MNTDEINVLLERAGCEKVPNTIRVWNCGSRHRAGKQIESLQNTIMMHGMHRQALAAALKKVLDERDALLRDVSNNCFVCANRKTDEKGNCVNAGGGIGCSHFVWRGPQPKEENKHV